MFPSCFVFNIVSSRITTSTDQFHKLRLTISALSAFKPSRHAPISAVPSNQPESIPSNRTDSIHSNPICVDQSDCGKEQDDVIERVAKAQETLPTPDKRIKEIGEEKRSTKLKSAFTGSRNRQVEFNLTAISKIALETMYGNESLRLYMIANDLN